ncbi:hypothetical protein POSPLADRAFT_1041345 [Postia placenta MAD-698-R-SB12]|uniref:Uncharacterized protein n=1 Tax=Postia placenta MAD-698-R-SB12 TaxID=670580 RepID=A0A1X6MPI9_9APHY|nr:hypothetical protein POSPLADRAFT_1041345 [Postia placenta MAD-698-R-SB12]OSX58126.1 hypothetical protein POSPLADRAFT_1041345 [Postia placenta MAD-698-R-SB12]
MSTSSNLREHELCGSAQEADCLQLDEGVRQCPDLGFTKSPLNTKDMPQSRLSFSMAVSPDICPKAQIYLVRAA